ncbi:MAG: hypothetical protein QNK37_36245 [Acidobacteriota bacterium]|nr:hypothetical protein [Acidobacteriota bacterium]
MNLFVLLLCLTAPVQTGKCADDVKSHQFDFWIGEWDVYAQGQLAGANSIKPILNGCVLQETWSGASGTAGSSFNHYNPATGKWHQYWVWQNGTTLPLLTGGLENGSMVLSGEQKGKDGSITLHRITWTPNKDGTVRQHWQTSKDSGKTWATSFDGTYKKKS